MLSARLLVSFLLSCLGTEAWADCASVQFSERNPIYCSILTINKDVDKDFAMKLSNYIYKYSSKYNQDPYRTVSIIAQESMFKNIHRKHTVLEIYEECVEEVCVEYVRKVRGYTDIGLYQFHAATIEAYGLDVLRLRDDIEYATEQHFLLMKDKLRECSYLKEEAWTCYHSATEKHRIKYKKLVNRFYNKIEEKKDDGSNQTSP